MRPSLANALSARAIHFTNQLAQLARTWPPQPDPIAPVVRRGSWAPKPDADGSVSVPFLQNLFNLTRPKREQRVAISSFLTSFPTRFGRFQTPDLTILGTIWGKKHWIWRNLCQIRLDRTGSWTDRERSRRFSTFFVLSGGFRPHPKPSLTRRKTDPQNPTLIRVGCGSGTSLPDLRQVGCRSDTSLPDLRRVGCGLGTNPTHGQP